jgi:lipopolysaccharide/colanic/teichoic acid biosynthesis glycosyltransferase
MSELKRGLYVQFGKRTLDILLAATLLPLVGPITMICAVAIYFDSRGSILYRQWRCGQNARPFRIFKLRTMVSGADKQGPRLTASGDSRITKVGRILRKTKLDELPQLLNVLRGDMSLVGPRPELPEFVSMYTPQERKIFEVKPGITGPASLIYVDEERLLAGSENREEFYLKRVMRDKLMVDLAYCRKICLLSDLALLLRTATTLFNVFRRQNFGKPQYRCDARSRVHDPGALPPITEAPRSGLSLVEQTSEKGAQEPLVVKP